jgi:hypothetical protein
MADVVEIGNYWFFHDRSERSCTSLLKYRTIVTKSPLSKRGQYSKLVNNNYPD